MFSKFTFNVHFLFDENTIQYVMMGFCKHTFLLLLSLTLIFNGLQSVIFLSLVSSSLVLKNLWICRCWKKGIRNKYISFCANSMNISHLNYDHLFPPTSCNILHCKTSNFPISIYLPLVVTCLSLIIQLNSFLNCVLYSTSLALILFTAAWTHITYNFMCVCYIHTIHIMSSHI